VELVKNGKTTYSIVLRTAATQAEKDAAKIVQSTIDSMTGAVLKIVNGNIKSVKRGIFITSDTDFEYKKMSGELRKDGFWLFAKNRKIIIKGKDRGVVYGAVHLLEKYLGCRYFSPAFQVMPKQKNVILPEINVVENPDNVLRFVNGVYTQENREYRDWLRLNNHADEFASGYFVHTFNKLLPAEEHFDSHPEYFSMVNGRRTRDQLCMTNPEVKRLVIRKLREEMSRQPSQKIWSVSQNDNPFYCHCASCAAVTAEEGAPAGPLIHFINTVADSFPTKIISTLAYQFSRHAPVKVKPRDNVQIMLCTIELNRSKPIASDPGSASFVKDIKDWSRLTNHIFLWDYTVDFAHHITPFPNLHVLADNIRFFYNHGVRIHFQQSNVDIGHEFSELKAYLISRLLWHTDVDVDSVKHAFINGYYGPAGSYILKYIEALELSLKTSGEHLDIYGHPTAHQSSFLSAQNIAKYNEWFDMAEQSVVGDAQRLNHVRLARLPLQYAMIEIGKSEMFSERGFYYLHGNEPIIRPAMRDLLPKFLEVCRLNHVKGVNESGLTPEAYIESSYRTLDIKIHNNPAFGKKVTATPNASTKYSSGDVGILTNGVHGSNDYRVHWLGWEGLDFELNLDLEKEINPENIQLSSLYMPNSWVLHPSSVQCYISRDGINFTDVGKITVLGDQKKEAVNRTFTFDQNLHSCRYIKFNISGTKTLPAWHPAYGGTSWTFIDEIVVNKKE
jgi:hypothetical protein